MMGRIGPYRMVLFGALGILSLLAVACAGSTTAGDVQAPQQPAPAAQPAAAAPAADPQSPSPSIPATSGDSLPGIAPAPEAPAEGPRYGGILRVGHRDDPPAAWDVMRSTNYNNTLILPSIYGPGNLGMPCRGEELRVCPALSESWEASDDFSVWTFKIRDNVLWHDGRAFSAEDAAYWANLFVNGVTVGDRTRQPGTNKSRFGDLQSIDTLPGNQIRFNLGGPDPLFLDKVGLFRIYIQHGKHLAEPHIRAGNVDVSPVDMGYIGTGPFKFNDYEKGVAIEVRRFEDYYETDEQGRQLPYLDGVDFLIIKEGSAFHAAFRTGRLDTGIKARGYHLPPEMIPAYRGSLGDGFWLGERTGGDSPNMGFNTTVPPFNDIRVRRAISLWVDRQSAKDAFGGGFGKLAGMMGDSYWWNPDLLTWPGYNAATREADRASAKRLMAEAGYADGLSFSLLAPRTFGQKAEWWQGALKGIANVELDLLDVAAHDQKVSESNYVAVEGSVGGTSPDDLITTLAAKDVSPYAKVVHYDAKMTDFLNRMANATTLDARRDVIRQMEKYVLQDQVLGIRTFVGVDLTPYRDYVKGIYHPSTLTYNTFASYATVWLDK